jgi:hypothetical protein
MSQPTLTPAPPPLESAPGKKTLVYQAKCPVCDDVKGQLAPLISAGQVGTMDVDTEAPPAISERLQNVPVVTIQDPATGAVLDVCHFTADEKGVACESGAAYSIPPPKSQPGVPPKA